MPDELDGKVAIITGAARGVGQAIARRFAESGAAVMLADQDIAQCTEEAEQLQKQGARAAAFRCDPCAKLDLNNLLAATLNSFDRVDVVVNAAVDPGLGAALDIDDSVFDHALSNNLRASVRLSQLAARQMIKQAEAEEKTTNIGSIVNITSVYATRVAPERFALSVSMAALDQATRCLAVELAPFGVRVNGVAPGGVTGRWGGLADPAVRRAVTERTPMSRLGDPGEIAESALFLAGARSSFVTGQILTVDGGRSLFDMEIPKAS